MPKLYTLKDTPENFTDLWADYGSEICVDDCSCLSLWLDLKKNNSQDMRIRALARHTQGGGLYIFPIKTMSNSVVNIEDEYFEFTTDEDQKRIIGFTFDSVIPYVQFQIQAGIVGALAGQILNSNYVIR